MNSTFRPRPVVIVAACLLPAILASAGCGLDDGDGHSHSGTTYYSSAHFHDPYYYGPGYYDYYDDVVVVPPGYNNGNKPGKPDRPGAGERPGNGLKPTHPIAGVPGNRPARPSAQPRATPSIPSRARPSGMSRSGSFRGGGGFRGGGRR